MARVPIVKRYNPSIEEFNVEFIETDENFVPNSTGTCLVHYSIHPLLTAEGVEDDTMMLERVETAFKQGRATYIGFTFPETPERLTEQDNVTNVFFTLTLAGITPFNGEADFTDVIIYALDAGDSEIAGGGYYEDSVNIKKIDIAITEAYKNKEKVINFKSSLLYDVPTEKLLLKVRGPNSSLAASELLQRAMKNNDKTE